MKQKPLVHWEGFIIKVLKDEFVALVKDLKFKNEPDMEVTIPFKSIIKSEQKFISKGAIFHWKIVNSEKANSKKDSIYTFNKDVWTKSELDHAKKRAAELSNKLFNR